MMTADDIQERVFDIVAREARVDRVGLTRDTRISDLRIESLSMVQILFVVEEAFDVYVPLEHVPQGFATLGDLIDTVQALIAAK
jgi:acyl carrier protein